MQHNQKGGVIMSNSDLALQGVTRQQAGNYTCIASNVEGDGDSNNVQLKIMCKYKSNLLQLFILLHRMLCQIFCSSLLLNYSSNSGEMRRSLLIKCVSQINLCVE